MQTAQSGLRAFFSAAYSLLWLLAGPFVFLSPRMRQGWKERLGLGRIDPCDIWIQGASAGECALMPMLLDKLPPYCVLATTCTAQGKDIISKISSTGCLQARMLPLDLPWLMQRMLKKARPKAVVLLETEIWPGLLLACSKLHIPIIFLNARMSAKSLPGYLFLRPTLKSCAPTAIAAISTEDARRFRLVFGNTNIEVAGNIKFDRALDTSFLPSESNPLACFINDQEFYVLGSIREEEEVRIVRLIEAIRRYRPQATIGLFPRHMHRCKPWVDLLKQRSLKHVLRSELNAAASAGSVIIWDVFGELGTAYALARHSFVGGSLARLGGQNFLEPLIQGVGAVVGPYTRNFDWVGQEIFDELVFRSSKISELAKHMIEHSLPRETVRTQTLAYIASRQGAAEKCAQILTSTLSRNAHA